MLVPPDILIGWFVLNASHLYYICFMKMCILFITTGFLLSSCNKANTAIKDRLLETDSIAINYFAGDGRMDTVVAVKIIRDKEIITRLTNQISAKTIVQNHQCGYDGSLHFFKMNKVIQDIYFNMNGAGCMQFSFLQDGKYAATALSEEAKQALLLARK